MGCSSSQPIEDGSAPVSQKITAQPRALRRRVLHPFPAAKRNQADLPSSVSGRDESESTAIGNKREAEQRLVDLHSNNNDNTQSTSVLQIPVIDVSQGLEVIASAPAGAGTIVDGNTTNIEPPIESGIIDVGHPPTPPTSCCFCIEDIFDSDVDPLLRPCGRCHRPCCKNCIRKLFMDACKDESDMPPNCCIPIPIAYASIVLSIEEVSVFKEKYEEWGTPNRVYCPVPTCSAFIPDRLFPVPEEPNPRVGGRPVLAKKSSSQTIIPVNSLPTPPSSCPSPTFETISSIPCPKCGIDICCSCKQLSHPGSSCSEVPDLDPELADLLKRWGIKRCPKCRAAVRRMFGCSHIQCRCGAQWCWFCTAPYDVCRAQRCPREEEGERFERELNDASDQFYEDLENATETQDNVESQEPTGAGNQESTVDNQNLASVENQEPLTNENEEPVVVNQEPALGTQEPPGANREPAVEIQEPSGANQEPAAEIQGPLGANQEPAVEINEPAVGIEETAVQNQEPAVGAQQHQIESVESQPSIDGPQQSENVQITQTPESQFLANLDAGWRWDEAEEFFGNEPNFYMINPFTCLHSWDYLEESDVDKRVAYECTRCWQRINPRPNGYVYLGLKDLFETGTFREVATDEAESSHEIKGPFILACKRCAVTLCPTCELKTRGQRRVRTEWGRPYL